MMASATAEEPDCAMGEDVVGGVTRGQSRCGAA